MNKKLIIGGIALIVAGYAVYRYFFLSDATDTLETVVENSNPNLLTQPSQFAPYEKISEPRVDFADQPWYTGSREFENFKSEDAFNVDLFQTIH